MPVKHWLATAWLIALTGFLPLAAHAQDQGGRAGAFAFDRSNADQAPPDMRAYLLADENDPVGQKIREAFFLKSDVAQLAAAGKMAGAEAKADEAEALYKELRAADPGNADLTYSHANLFLVLGISYQTLEEWTKARSSLLKARRVFQEGIFSGETVAIQYEQLTLIEGMLSGSSMAEGDGGKMLDHARASLEYSEKLWSLDPERQTYLSQLAIRLLNLALALDYINSDYAEAHALLQRATTLHRAAAERDPKNLVNVVSASYLMVEDSLMVLAMGDAGLASDLAAAASDNFAKIVEIVPGNAEQHANFAKALYALAEAQFALGNTDVAEGVLHNSKFHYEQAFEQHFKDDWAAFASFVYGRLGDVYRIKDEPGDALLYFTAARDQLTPLINERAHPEWRARLAHYQNAVTEIEASQ